LGQNGQALARFFVIGVQGDHVFQANLLLFWAIYHRAHPHPGHFVAFVHIHGLQEQFFGFGFIIVLKGRYRLFD
jgi:hypothetical protein